MPFVSFFTSASVTGRGGCLGWQFPSFMLQHTEAMLSSVRNRWLARLILLAWWFTGLLLCSWLLHKGLSFFSSKGRKLNCSTKRFWKPFDRVSWIVWAKSFTYNTRLLNSLQDLYNCFCSYSITNRENIDQYSVHSYWDNVFLKLCLGSLDVFLRSQRSRRNTVMNLFSRIVCDVYKEVKSPLKILNVINGKHSALTLTALRGHY